MFEDIFNLDLFLGGIENFLVGPGSILKTVYDLASITLGVVIGIMGSSTFSHFLGLILSGVTHLDILFIAVEGAIVVYSCLSGGGFFNMAATFLSLNYSLIRFITSIIVGVFQLLAYIVGAVAGNIPGL
jgi:hypothetical protein